MARATSFASPLNYLPDKEQTLLKDRLLDWCTLAISAHSNDLHSPFLSIAILWNIWKSRCARLFEGFTSHPPVILRKAFQDEEFWLKQGQHKAPKTNMSITNMEWHPPPTGYLKMNFDGVTSEQCGAGG